MARGTSKEANEKLCYDTDLLLVLIDESISSAREQVRRSRQLVAHSRELVARVQLSLARAHRLHHSMSGPGNPRIQ